MSVMSVRGFKADMIILDECANLFPSTDAIDALAYSMETNWTVPMIRFGCAKVFEARGEDKRDICRTCKFGILQEVSERGCRGDLKYEEAIVG